jgi:aminoglycoside N3'-acetyltransferase
VLLHEFFTSIFILLLVHYILGSKLLLIYVNENTILHKLDQRMSQHYGVIGQHNIIKNQETKIHELKEELRVAAVREEVRYLQMT